jgi:hypothetical protein
MRSTFSGLEVVLTAVACLAFGVGSGWFIAHRACVREEAAMQSRDLSLLRMASGNKMPSIYPCFDASRGKSFVVDYSGSVMPSAPYPPCPRSDPEHGTFVY